MKGVHTTTPTEYCLQHILQLVTPFGPSFPMLSKLAEVILSMPVSNAWPERGASAVKRIKTRLRNRISNKMLETVMHVNINGADPTSTDAEEVVTQSVQLWYEAKQRRKLPKPGIQEEETITYVVEHQDASTQANFLPENVPEESQTRDLDEKMQKVLDMLNVGNKEYESGLDSSESEDEVDYEVEFEHECM
jgi:hypothetical protein